MVSVKVEKTCACFKRSYLPSFVECKDMIEAQKKAEEICTYANTEFCLTHEYTPVEEDNSINIKVKVRER